MKVLLQLIINLLIDGINLKEETKKRVIVEIKASISLLAKNLNEKINIIPINIINSNTYLGD